MTTRQGKIKADRKAKLQKIYLDDLASMENLTIVRLQLISIIAHLFKLCLHYRKVL